jgi:hypothetical protein
MAVAGLAIVAGYGLASRLQMVRHEQEAADRLAAIADAQEAFRADGGRGGYASSLESLTSACPGAGTPMLRERLTGGRIVTGGYAFSLRPHRDATPAGTDCFGRVTMTDFVASAAPISVGVDGLRAMSVVAGRRLFVFFDGVAPAEADMTSGGLAAETGLGGTLRTLEPGTVEPSTPRTLEPLPR